MHYLCAWVYKSTALSLLSLKSHKADLSEWMRPSTAVLWGKHPLNSSKHYNLTCGSVTLIRNPCIKSAYRLLYLRWDSKIYFYEEYVYLEKKTHGWFDSWASYRNKKSWCLFHCSIPYYADAPPTDDPYQHGLGLGKSETRLVKVKIQLISTCVERITY